MIIKSIMIMITTTTTTTTTTITAICHTCLRVQHSTHRVNSSHIKLRFSAAS